MRFNRREVEGRVGAWAFRMIQRWLGGKDLLGAEKIGERLGQLSYRLLKKRRLRALSNLELAFPEKSEEERRAIAKGVFEHFGRVMCDFVRTANRTPEEVLSSIQTRGLENLHQAIALGKGAIVVTGHFGNWERMAQFISLSGFKMSVIVRDANNEDLNNLVLELRKAAGVGIISRGNAARPVLTKLRNNEVIGILPDQNAGDAFIPFFGKTCGTAFGPAVLGERAGAPLVPIYCYRVGPGKYVYETHPPLEPVPGYPPSEGMMRAVNNSLEAMIRKYPDQYLWIHDRWKSARQQGLL
jgi:KDO2-lipid IV(A) lauroyltransferase